MESRGRSLGAAPAKRDPAPSEAPVSPEDGYALRGALALDQREIRGPGGEVVERWRLVELQSDPGRRARVVDHLRPRAGADAERPAVAREIMAPDSIVVGVPAGSTIGELAGRLRAAGFETRAPRAGDAVVVVQLPEATLDAVPDALRALAAALPDVTAEPNFLLFPFQATPSDYHAAEMWGLENIEAPAAWTVSTGSASVVVAVIDTGIDLTHPDLASNIWINTAEIAGNGVDDDGNGFIDDVSGWNFAEGNASAADADDHGTHVSGIIGAIGANGLGIAGINWSARLIPLRVGNRTFESANTLNALRYVNTMKERGVNLVAVNASFGGGSFSALFRDELIRARDNGVLFIAAAGNEGADNDVTPVYPANYDVGNVISVASMRPGNELSSFSNHGGAVDLAAPGTSIRSTVRGGGYEFFNGTSMAAPHVTGAAALIAAASPGIAAGAIRERILGSVDAVPALANLVATGGKLNLRRAVAPSLVPPVISITAPSVPLVLMDRAGVPLELTAALAEENGVSASASIAWETIEGPAPAAFADAGRLSTTVWFPQPGRYAIRVVATAGAFARSDELVVAIGAPGIAAPADGLVAWWSFNDTGGTARDSSGSGRAGTFAGGGPERVPGIDRGGVRFDGVNGRIAFSAPTLSRLSIAAWINPAADGGASIFPRVAQMQSGLLFLGQDRQASADDGNVNTLKFARDTGSDSRVWFAPRGSPGARAWSHVAAIFDATEGESATPQLYLEGEPLVVGTQSSAPTAPAVSPTVGYIGDRGDGGRPWNGALDEVRVYNRALTRAEIAVLAQGPELQSLLGARLSADLSSGSPAVPVAFSGGGEPPIAFSGVTWSALEGGASAAPTGPLEATVSFSSGGARTLRLDAVANGRAHVVRTLPMRVNTTPVNALARYAGSTSEGGVFALEIGAGGEGAFIGGVPGGIFQRSFAVSPFGTFAFEARDGSFVSGQIGPDGTVVGTLGSGATFAGVAKASPWADPALDGVYEGWILRGSARVFAIVSGGRITLAIEEPGEGRSGSGEVDTDGVFAFSGSSGAAFAGGIAGGRIELDFAVPGAAAREAVMLRADRTPVARLANLSTRGQAGAGDGAMIAGFVVRGAEPLPVLARGAGPGLVDFDVSGVLEQPRLALVNSGGAILGRNSGWDAGPGADALAAAFARTGAFDFAPGSRDAALLADVAGGSYTALITPVDGVAGNTLAEVYDARESASATTLVNLSARARVGQGDAVAIGGFVIEGRDPALVLVRAAGPSLGPLSVPGFLPLTELIVREGETLVARSEAWSEGSARRLLEEVSSAAGAFAFADGSADAALLLYLPPGAYTAEARGREGFTGIALVEIYLIDER